MTGLLSPAAAVALTLFIATGLVAVGATAVLSPMPVRDVLGVVAFGLGLLVVCGYRVVSVR